MGTPCITLRENTERPLTLFEHGGNSRLAGNDPQKVLNAFSEYRKLPRRPHRPPLWDGHTAERIVEALIKASVSFKETVN